VLHRAAYDALGLSGWRYDAVECAERRFAAFLGGLDESWVGLSLTMPLKQAALEVADSASELAVTLGAANTLLLGAAGRRAENTDVAGIAAALATPGWTAPDAVLLLGAGGTAAAALAALASLGRAAGAPVAVAVREPGRAGRLLAAAGRLGVTVELLAWAALRERSPADLVISAVPGGAAGTDVVALRPTSTVLDVAYHPWPTALARRAADLGASVIGGRDVLLHQAAGQVELMTGRPAPLAAMASALTRTG